ncbi:MAG TPA: Uma2 family endonuclease [Polyangiaceae bacterium]|nr:Uma2 family endonuclease [Polyangiaceae bacterium]
MHPARARFTFEEYLRVEEQSSIKHEFYEGEVYAMAGGTPEHAALSARLAVALGAQARQGGCEVFTSDLRVRIAATGLVTYPDLTLICGAWQRDPSDSRTVLNPTLLVEVLSASTASDDRGEKLANYQRIETLREVLLVAHDSPRLELWRKDETGRWLLLVANAGDALRLASVDTSLDVDDLYAGLLPSSSAAL